MLVVVVVVVPVWSMKRGVPPVAPGLVSTTLLRWTSLLPALSTMLSGIV